MNYFANPSKYIYLLFTVCFISSNFYSVAQQAAYEDRRAALREVVLNPIPDSTGNIPRDNPVIQAYEGVPVNRAEIDSLLKLAITSAEADFRLTPLLRILNLTDGEYEDQILPVIKEIPMWLPDPDNLRQYWSENHMCMWMSASWLLQEKYGWEMRPTLRQNLVQYLKLKVEYGYFEYFSPVYFPFTTAGLLNLVDFAEDEEIRDLAEQAVNRLLKEVLLLVNDKGVFYPTAGRSAYSRYVNPYNSDMARIAYLITGLGEAPTRTAIGSEAVATTSMDVSSLLASWEPEVSTTLNLGYPLSQSPQIHANLSREDRIIFDWSGGGYFHPFIAENTLWQLSNYNMWEHKEFSPFSFAQILPTSIGPVFATVAASITRSSYIGHVDIELFKNRGVTLVSSQDFWKGRLGYQQWPLAATIEETAVFTRSGDTPDWSSIPSRQTNTNLPYIDQDENVALIMYRHNWDLPIFGIDDFDVSLHFIEEDFDEVRELEHWILGMKNDSYVAVRRHCIEDRNGIRMCDVQDGQTWAIVVGNVEMHGSFDSFEEIISESHYESRWYFDWQNFKWVYYGRIKVDGQDIEYAWNGNVLAGPDNARMAGPDGERLAIIEGDVSIYPNPIQDVFTISLGEAIEDFTSLTIYNMEGKQMYATATLSKQNSIQVDASTWSNGIYSVVIAKGEALEAINIVVE